MRSATFALGLAAAMAAAPALAQDWALDPTYGTADLAAGFTPDPFVAEVVSSGGNDASATVGGGCLGMVADAPDFRVNYSAGGLPLQFLVESSSDTTLVINAPDTSWACNDDYEGLNPGVLFDSPMSGQYDIWVGSYQGDFAPANLIITEIPR